jgi:tRNA-modifying protein YgfZ
MTSDRYQSILTNGGAVCLSDRAKIRLTGGDRVRYLNGQVTNDVRRCTADQAVYACVTDAKGHILADVFIHALAEELRMDAEPGLRESLAARLDRYIVSDDVELSDITDNWSLWHVFGAAADGLVGVKADRIDFPGLDLWLPVGQPAPSHLPRLTEAEWETLRVLRGIPRWPTELTIQTFPPEAGLEDRAISYTKGCYIGQEIISRIRTTGKMPRRLVRLHSSALDLSPGMSLWHEGQVVGALTSVVAAPEGGQSALAYVKPTYSSADSVLLAGNDAPMIAVCLVNYLPV